MAANNKQAGFTLIEILVVIALFSVIAGFSLFVSFDMYRSYSGRGEENTLVSILQKARSRAMSNVDGKKQGVHLTSTNYTIFETDSDYNGRVSSKDIDFQVGHGFSPSGNDIIFTQLSGTTSLATLNITDTNTGKIYTINLNAEGQINY